MKEPNDRVVNALIEEEIEEVKKQLKKLKKNLSCKHVWKYIENYYAEDCHWECKRCKYRKYVME